MGARFASSTRTARRLAASCAALLVAACGARTGLRVPDGDAGDDALVVPDVGTRQLANRLGQTRVGSVDLLFVVDNSSSMSDKQSELGRRVPQLIKTLTNPDPDPATGLPKTPPVADLHVGVVTTSLGSFGTSVCKPTSDHDYDDQGHLLPRTSVPSGVGFHVDADGATPVASACPNPFMATPVSWVYDPSGDARYHGSGDSAAMQTTVSCAVTSASDDGCGYEMTLESLYRFLVDPRPYASATATCKPKVNGDDCGTSEIVRDGVDDVLLSERAAFLRNDSLVAVVILSDENDASFAPMAQNWLPLAKPVGSMPRGVSACAHVPDDVEPDDALGVADLRVTYGCLPCDVGIDDPACKRPWPAAPSAADWDVDERNLRAFEHVRRYGRSFLWGRRRYVDGLTKALVDDGDGKLVKNPLYAGGLRTPELVVVAGIVGVPKFLVADATGHPKPLTEADWDKIVSPDHDKRDPHMIESIGPRPGLLAYTGDWKVDPVHGGERPIVDGDDLQYACIAPRAATDATRPCSDPDAWKTNPVCAKDGTQPRLRAYPGVRHLRVLHDIGGSGLVASICDSSYEPAIEGITDRLERVVAGQCLMTPFAHDERGAVDCAMLQVFEAARADGKARCEDLGAGYCTPGSAPCRATPESAAVAAAKISLPIAVHDASGTHAEESAPFVDGGNVLVAGSDGVRRLVCELEQLVQPTVDETESARCRTDPGFTLPKGQGGWCYATATPLVGEQCALAGSKGKMRFLGDVTPRGELFTVCR